MLGLKLNHVSKRDPKSSSDMIQTCSEIQHFTWVTFLSHWQNEILLTVEVNSVLAADVSQTWTFPAWMTTCVVLVDWSPSNTRHDEPAWTLGLLYNKEELVSDWLSLTAFLGTADTIKSTWIHSNNKFMVSKWTELIYLRSMWKQITNFICSFNNHIISYTIHS